MMLSQPISRAVSEALAPLVDLIWPPRCPLCGEGIAAQTGLCSACWSTLEFAEPEDGILAAVTYNDPARELVLAFKRGGKIALAPVLARMMAARVGPLGDRWLAVPVPLHRWRLWQRGYNQSALLARELAQLCGTGFAVDALVRRKYTPSLGPLGSADRAQVLEGAIAARPGASTRLAGARVLLVDDVLTSGATTRACIAALREAGVAEVRTVCFARVAQA